MSRITKRPIALPPGVTITITEKKPANELDHDWSKQSRPVPKNKKLEPFNPED